MNEQPISQNPHVPPIPVTTPLTVTLEAQLWNIVMMALQKRPFEEVANLIPVIGDQLQRQAAIAAQSLQNRSINGHDASGLN